MILPSAMMGHRLPTFMTRFDIITKYGLKTVQYVQKGEKCIVVTKTNNFHKTKDALIFFVAVQLFIGSYIEPKFARTNQNA